MVQSVIWYPFAQTLTHISPFCTIKMAVLNMAPNYIINYLNNYRFYRSNFFIQTRYIIIHYKINKKSKYVKMSLGTFLH